MFEPEYGLTNEIVNNLMRIAAAREIVENARLIPNWEVELRRDAIKKSAHASTSIEGNPLTEEEVTELAAGREVMASRKSQQEVLNYLDVLEDIPEHADREQIDEETILGLHASITKEVIENPDYSGKYRDEKVVVENGVTGEIVYEPPPASKVPGLMSDLIEWLSSSEAGELDPVLEAGITHYELVRIHPFTDGNGRTARALATLILYMRGFDTKRFFALDDYYDSDRPAYYQALQEAESDLTPWLEYFTKGVAISISRVKDRVLDLSRNHRRKIKEGQIPLTERQMKIVELIYDRGSVSSGNLQEFFDISRQAVHKETTKLRELNVIKKVGDGRGAKYVLT